MDKRIIIQGHTPSKSNSYQIVRISNRCRIAKTNELLNYERNFAFQLPLKLKGKLIQDFAIDIDVYFRSNRSDLDNSLKIILDCLQSNKVIKNDNLCREIHARKHIDKFNPRIEFEIKQLA